MTRVLAWAAVAAFSTACAARSEDDLRAEFKAFVDEHNLCRTSDDCVLASAGCPLGCSVAVNAEHETKVEQKAQQLVTEYESSGRKCYYECAVVRAACEEGRCQLVPQ